MIIFPTVLGYISTELQQTKAHIFYGGGTNSTGIMLRYPKQNDVLCGLHQAIPGTFMDINIGINKYKPALQYIHCA